MKFYQEGRAHFARATIICIATCVFFQFFTLWLYTLPEPWNRKKKIFFLKESVYILTFLSPVVHVYRVTVTNPSAHTMKVFFNEL